MCATIAEIMNGNKNNSDFFLSSRAPARMAHKGWRTGATRDGGFEAIKRQTSGVNLRFLINLDALVQNNISTEGTNH